MGEDRRFFSDVLTPATAGLRFAYNAAAGACIFIRFRFPSLSLLLSQH